MKNFYKILPLFVVGLLFCFPLVSNAQKKYKNKTTNQKKKTVSKETTVNQNVTPEVNQNMVSEVTIKLSNAYLTVAKSILENGREATLRDLKKDKYTPTSILEDFESSKDDTKLMVEYASMAILHNPNNGDAYHIRGSVNCIIRRTGGNWQNELETTNSYPKLSNTKLKDCIGDFSKAIELNTEYVGFAYYFRGSNQGILGYSKEAISDYDKSLNLLLKRKEESGIPYYIVRIFFNRGYSKFQLKDYNGAIKDFSESLKIDDKFAPAFLQRGNAKRFLGDKTGCNDWKKATELGIGVEIENFQKVCSQR